MECKYIHHTYQVNGVQQNTLGHNDVLLDTHANISIVHPDLWWDVQRADHDRSKLMVWKDTSFQWTWSMQVRRHRQMYSVSLK